MAATINRDDITIFLNKVSNEFGNKKCKHYKLMFAMFINGHSTKRQEIRLKQFDKNGSSKYMYYPIRPYNVKPVPPTSFKEFVEQLEKLELLVVTDDWGKLDTDLIKTFPEGNHLLKELS